MINISDPTDIGPVSITTDPTKFQQDLQELFVQVGTRTVVRLTSSLRFHFICNVVTLCTHELFIHWEVSDPLLVSVILLFLCTDSNFNNLLATSMFTLNKSTWTS